ncbi:MULTISPECIES: hypothetical protein [Methylobacterium]|uniref:hypothetical protein n=1 Tax=Methylobacterium TaxID=407 RepID=UPI0013E9D56E|nr:hypothetical protein [Methylobacterium sp. DB0501]NGM35908.1 hypothetical protein [Methylobacterium sp. DB0501]
MQLRRRRKGAARPARDREAADRDAVGGGRIVRADRHPVDDSTGGMVDAASTELDGRDDEAVEPRRAMV